MLNPKRHVPMALSLVKYWSERHLLFCVTWGLRTLVDENIQVYTPKINFIAHYYYWNLNRWSEDKDTTQAHQDTKGLYKVWLKSKTTKRFVNSSFEIYYEVYK